MTKIQHIKGGKANKWRRCGKCGKFIGYEEMSSGNVNQIFEPETEYTSEYTSVEHKKCKR